jgi:uncharacterized SAM-binding protein YcdF (DUF218 family)
MSHAGLSKSPWAGALYAAGVAALVAALGWVGLRTLVAHATGSRPDHLDADIIVPLAGSADRIEYAHTLWSRRVAPALGSTLVDRRCLHRLGPDPRCATGVRNTVDEALVLRRFFEEERVTRAIIVTSRYHLARTRAIFSVIFAGTGIDVHFVATPDSSAVSHAVTKEVRSYLPSLGAAVVARMSPPAYEWSMRSLRTLRSLRHALSSGSTQ